MGAAVGASVRPMVTYIGGLHSPPVTQPTAIHQDIQLEGKGVGWGQADRATEVGGLRPGSGSSWLS